MKEKLQTTKCKASEGEESAPADEGDEAHGTEAMQEKAPEDSTEDADSERNDEVDPPGMAHM